MLKISDIRKHLPEPGSNFEKLMSRQNVYDITREVMRQHDINRDECDRISELFWTGDAKSTVDGIFDFCKKNMPYRFEPSRKQTVKTISQILHDAELGGIAQDCKHYALTCCGLLDSLSRKGYPIGCMYRFCSDVPGEKWPKHVFCVALLDGREYWCDPVLSQVNQDYKYYFTLDKNPNMALYRVSGLESHTSGYVSGFGDMGKHGNGWRKFKKGIKSINPGELFVKGTMALPRNSFLLLLKVNMFQMSRHMFELAQNEAGKNKLKNFWRKMGGRWGSMAKAINDGYHHYLFEHKRKMPPGLHNISGLQDSGYIGVAPVAAAIATATPIVLAAIKLLADMGVHINPKVVTDAKDKAVNLLGDKFNEHGETTPEGTEMEAGDDGGKQTLVVKKLHKGNDNHEADIAPDVKTPAEVANDDEDAPKMLTTKDTKVIDLNKEIPDAENPVGTGVNVATDWGKGIGVFVQNNKGIVITGVVALAVIMVSKNVFSHGKHR